MPAIPTVSRAIRRSTSSGTNAKCTGCDGRVMWFSRPQLGKLKLKAVPDHILANVYGEDV